MVFRGGAGLNVNQRYEAGVLREQWDDSSRIYTKWDENGAVVESRSYSPEEDAQADADADQNARLDSLEERVDAIEEIVLDRPDRS